MTTGEIWREPVRGSYPEPWALSLPGSERLALFRREIAPQPPLHRLTGARPTGYGEGTAEAAMPAGAWLANGTGLIGGGVLAILADIAFGLSLETLMPARTPYTTAELSLTFLRPARVGTTLTAHGQSIHVGRSVGLSEAFVIDARDDALIAHGTSRLSILPEIDGLPEPPADPQPPPPARHASLDPHLRPAPADAVLAPELWSSLPGRELLERYIADELPRPGIHRLTGIRPTEVGEGTAAASMPATEWLNSPARRLQGGAIAMLADFALSSAVLSITGAGVATAGLDLKVNFLRPVPGDGRELTARARIEHAGRTLAIARGRVDNDDGKPVMLATGTTMLLPGRPPSLEPGIELARG